MPYAVWIDVSDPDPGVADEVARAQRPQLILELIEAGWTGPGIDDDDEDRPSVAEDDDDEEVRALLDVRVLAYPDGAIIGLAVDTDQIGIAIEVGLSLAHHLAGTPALFGWTLDSLRTEKLSSPRASGMWLPPVHDDPARFPVAAYLPDELQDLSAQYLLVAAARGINDPTGKAQGTVDAADLVAGSTAEHPWDRELSDELGTLLVAACRLEAATGTRSPLVARGGGDPQLAQALLDIIRSDYESPSTDYEDDDAMRGHVLVERFMAEHDLRWNWHDSDDPVIGEERSREQFRALLRAGLRALATLGKDTLQHAQSPWLWLAELDSDDIDPVVAEFAHRDDEEIEQASEETEAELSTAADAHLMVRVALLHATLFEQHPLEDFPGLSDVATTAGPLHHVVYASLLSFGVEAVQAVLDTPHADIARAVLPAMQAIEAEDDETDPYDDLRHALEDLLPRGSSAGAQSKRRAMSVLRFLAAVAAAARQDRAEEIARQLFHYPAQLACVIVHSLGEDEIDSVLRMRVLASAAAIDTTMAGQAASDLPALRSSDPREEPALRADALNWWNDAVQVSQRLRVREHVDLAAINCPEPGASLFNMLSAPDPASKSLFDGMATATVAVGVVQAVSALSLLMRDPEVAHEILPAWD